jgi:hypothetical protein
VSIGPAAGWGLAVHKESSSVVRLGTSFLHWSCMASRTDLGVSLSCCTAAPAAAAPAAAAAGPRRRVRRRSASWSG